MSEIKEYRYKAFISYSHIDEKWGRWLHRRIEGYRVPAGLIGLDTLYGPVPKRLFPVFRDREELPTASDLSQIIDQALINSSHLIVICSPNSAKSQWVNEEVKAFKKLGKQNRILCLIVDGEPNADSKPEIGLEECFPSAVKVSADKEGNLTDIETEPIAADAREGKDGKVNAMLKVLAGLLGVGFDEIKQRDLLRKQKRVAIMGTASLSLALVMGMLSVWAIGNSREAERQKIIAVAAKTEAEDQKDEAVRQKKLATEARSVAEKQEKIAVSAKLESEEKKDEALDKLYDLVIFRADNQFENGNEKLAGETLLKAPVDRRNFEWGYLFNEVNDHIVQIKAPNTKMLMSADINPTGNLIVISGKGVNANIHEIKSGSIIRKLKNSLDIHSLNFSSDGSKIFGLTYVPVELRSLSSIHGKIKCWDAMSGSELTLNGKLSKVEKVAEMAISPDNNLIVMGYDDNSVILCDIKSGEQLSILNKKEKDKVVSSGKLNMGITDVVFSYDGRKIYASTADNRIFIWDRNSGRRDFMSLDNKNTFCHGIAISSNQKHMISRHFSKSVIGYKINEVQKKSELTFVALWDLELGKIIKKIISSEEQDFAWGAEFSDDGKSFIVIGNYNVSKYGLDGKLKAIPIADNYVGFRAGGFLNKNERIIYTAESDRIRFWRSNTYEIDPLRAMELNQDVNIYSKYDKDGDNILLSFQRGDNSLSIIYNLYKNSTQRLHNLSGATRVSSFSPDGKKIATNGYNTIGQFNKGNYSVMISDIETGKVLDQIEGKEFAKGLAYTADGDNLVIATEKEIRVWDIVGNNFIKTMDSSDNLITCMSVTPNGDKIITGHTGLSEKSEFANIPNSVNAGAKIWGAKTGEIEQELLGHTAKITSIDCSNKGDIITTGSFDGTVRLWSAETAKQLNKIDLEKHKINEGFVVVKFFPDNKRILIAYSHYVEIWNPFSTEPLIEISKSKSRLTSVTIHPDGKSVLMGTNDKKIRVKTSVPWKNDEYPFKGSGKSFQSRYNVWSFDRYLKNSNWHENVVKGKISDNLNMQRVATNFKTMPEIDLSNFTEKQRKSILDITNKEFCDCGCKLTIAQCRNEDSSCRRSIPMAWNVVEKVTGYKNKSVNYDVNSDKNRTKIKEFISAVYDGDLTKVVELLSDGIDVNLKVGEDKATILHFLAKVINDNTPELRHLQMAKLIIDKGGNVNGLTEKGFTPLHLTESVNFTQQLIDRGANVNLIDEDGRTPLDAINDKDNAVKIFDVLKANGAQSGKILKAQGKLSEKSRQERQVDSSQLEFKENLWHVTGESQPYTGHVKGWSEDGWKKFEGSYLRGVQDGNWRNWWENGQLQSSVNMDNGTPNGEAQYWYNNGQMRQQGNWVNGQYNPTAKWTKEGDPEPLE